MEFLPYISFIVAFIASECIKYIGKAYGAALCILSFTACLLKPQSILNFKGRFTFVSKSIPLVACYVHPPGGWIYYFCFFCRPMSGVTHGFRSFKGKVLELLSPNLVCRLIGSVACLGLLLAVVPLFLTE